MASLQLLSLLFEKEYGHHTLSAVCRNIYCPRFAYIDRQDARYVGDAGPDSMTLARAGLINSLSA